MDMPVIFIFIIFTFLLQVLKVADGNTDVNGIRKAIAQAKAEKNKPTLIMVKTVIGYGAPTKANSHDAHGAPLGKDEAAAARKNLGWEFGEFEIPEQALNTFRQAIPRGIVHPPSVADEDIFV